MAGKSNRGGAGRGQGRKANPLKVLRTGALTAAKILDELKHEEEIKTLYKDCGDYRLKVFILFKLREWAFGKPMQPQEDTVVFDPNQPLRVIIEHIGSPTGDRPKNSPAAKTK